MILTNSLTPRELSLTPSSRLRLNGKVLRGFALTRKKGRPPGRPRSASLKAEQVNRLKAEGLSHSEIPRRLGIGRASVRRALALPG